MNAGKRAARHQNAQESIEHSVNVLSCLCQEPMVPKAVPARFLNPERSLMQMERLADKLERLKDILLNATGELDGFPEAVDKAKAWLDEQPITGALEPPPDDTSLTMPAPDPESETPKEVIEFGKTKGKHQHRK